MQIGAKKLATFFVTVAFVAAPNIVAARPPVLVGQLESPPVPSERVAWNGSRIPHGSLEESKQRVKESAPFVMYCNIRGKLLYRTYGLRELLNSAIDLAQSGNPNAEYLIGWMYESTVNGSDVAAICADVGGI